MVGSFFNCDSLSAKLNSYYNAWSYKKKKYKKIKAYMKSVYKENTIKSCLLIVELKSFRSTVKGKYSIGRKFQSLAMQGKKTVDIGILVTSRNGDTKIVQSIRITIRLSSRIRKWNQFSQFRLTSTKVTPIEKTLATF